jgi:hypothetical protein
MFFVTTIDGNSFQGLLVLRVTTVKIVASYQGLQFFQLDIDDQPRVTFTMRSMPSNKIDIHY